VIKRDWLARPAVTRISAASATALRPFVAGYNHDRPYAQQIKPFNFLLCVQVAPFAHPAGYPPQRFQLVHPYEPDPRRWLQLHWIDHYSGDRFHIHTNGSPAPDSVKVKTNQDILDRYHRHPEPKSLDPDGTPCRPDSHGLLAHRPVTATEISYIGKEGHRLEDRAAGLLHDPAEAVLQYGDPALDPWHTLVLPTLRDLNTAELAAAADLDRRSIQRLLNHHSYPRQSHRNTLTTIAVEHARTALLAHRIEPPTNATAVLRLYQDTIKTRPTCAICGGDLPSPRATYCSDRCKKRAWRTRHRR
jgi:hypothetical protein